MSTYIYMYCMTHEENPRDESLGNEIDQRVSEYVIEGVRKMVKDRQRIVEFCKTYGYIEFEDQYENRVRNFLRAHPECELALVTEYDDWFDLGWGIPEGKNYNRDFGMIGADPIEIHIVSHGSQIAICELAADYVWYSCSPYIPEGINEKNTYLCYNCKNIIKRKWRV